MTTENNQNSNTEQTTAPKTGFFKRHSGKLKTGALAVVTVGIAGGAAFLVMKARETVADTVGV